ncbi:MAG: hypothetical protein RR135_06805, partial [Oscillospiraceae bacterium]
RKAMLATITHKNLFCNGGIPMRKNKRPDNLILPRKITKQTNLPINKMLERRPQKRAVFHRIGSRER